MYIWLPDLLFVCGFTSLLTALGLLMTWPAWVIVAGAGVVFILYAVLAARSAVNVKKRFF